MTLVYYSNGSIFFDRNGLVFRSIKTFALKPTHEFCFEWKIFGLMPEDQPRFEIIEISKTLTHPDDCILDIDATFNLLRYRLIYGSLIKNIIT